MKKPPSLLRRLLTSALLETLICSAAIAFIAIGGKGYVDYLLGSDANLPYIPVMYAFGLWPFAIAAGIAVAFGLLAWMKALRH